MVSKTSLVLTVLGVLLLVAGVVFLALDLSGMGDTAGFDPKDLGFVVVGAILLGVGLGLRSRS